MINNPTFNSKAISTLPVKRKSLGTLSDIVGSPVHKHRRTENLEIVVNDIQSRKNDYKFAMNLCDKFIVESSNELESYEKINKLQFAIRHLNMAYNIVTNTISTYENLRESSFGNKNVAKLLQKN